METKKTVRVILAVFVASLLVPSVFGCLCSPYDDFEEMAGRSILTGETVEGEFCGTGVVGALCTDQMIDRFNRNNRMDSKIGESIIEYGVPGCSDFIWFEDDCIIFGDELPHGTSCGLSLEGSVTCSLIDGSDEYSCITKITWPDSKTCDTWKNSVWSFILMTLIPLLITILIVYFLFRNKEILAFTSLISFGVIQALAFLSLGLYFVNLLSGFFSTIMFLVPSIAGALGLYLTVKKKYKKARIVLFSIFLIYALWWYFILIETYQFSIGFY